MRNNRAFTLAEVLLVSSIFALISLAVFNAFANGFKIWARTEHVMAEGDTAIFLEKMAEDLRQTLIISGIPFKGGSAELSFPAVIWAPADLNGLRAPEGTTEQVGAVRYRFDALQKKIFRYQAAYGQALKSQWSQPREAADLIEDISLRYYFKADRGLDVKSQTDEGVPLGILIDVKFLVEGREFHMRRFMPVPVGGGV